MQGGVEKRPPLCYHKGNMNTTPSPSIVPAVPRQAAFTLIELLVVVSVIIVVVAMLVPAIETAVYQAKLATCEATQKAVVTGMVAGAVDRQGYYPDRSGATTPHTISQADADHRPVIRQYLNNLKATFNCPLVIPADYDFAQPNSYLFTSYWMWFGFNTGNVTGLMRLGDRWELGNELSTLAFQDYDVVRMGTNIWGSHPDDNRVMANVFYEWSTLTASFWENATTDKRGLIDMNAAFQDASVSRYTRVEPTDLAAGTYDLRMKLVPNAPVADPAQWGVAPRQ